MVPQSRHRTRLPGKRRGSTMATPYLEIQPGDMETIAAPLDFLGVNYYTRKVWHDAAERH